jgi:hypothetical protein
LEEIKPSLVLESNHRLQDFVALPSIGKLERAKDMLLENPDELASKITYSGDVTPSLNIGGKLRLEAERDSTKPRLQSLHSLSLIMFGSDCDVETERGTMYEGKEPITLVKCPSNPCL